MVKEEPEELPATSRELTEADVARWLEEEETAKEERDRKSREAGYSSFEALEEMFASPATNVTVTWDKLYDEPLEIRPRTVTVYRTPTEPVRRLTLEEVFAKMKTNPDVVRERRRRRLQALRKTNGPRRTFNPPPPTEFSPALKNYKIPRRETPFTEDVPELRSEDTMSETGKELSSSSTRIAESKNTRGLRTRGHNFTASKWRKSRPEKVRYFQRHSKELEDKNDPEVILISDTDDEAPAPPARRYTVSLNPSLHSVRKPAEIPEIVLVSDDEGAA